MRRSSSGLPWDQVFTGILGLAAISEAVFPPTTLSSKFQFLVFAFGLTAAGIWSINARRRKEASDYAALRDLIVTIAAPGTASPDRRLTELQTVRLVASLSQTPPQRVRIVASQGDETQGYALQFKRVLAASRWKVVGPVPAPITVAPMDLQVSINGGFFAGNIPTAYTSFRSILDFVGLKCRQKFVFDPAVAPDEIVLWVGAKSPDNMRPENYPPLALKPTGDGSHR